jgi:hypothetical protein
MPKTISFDGAIHQFPDDFTDADIQKALNSLHPQQLQGGGGSPPPPAKVPLPNELMATPKPGPLSRPPTNREAYGPPATGARAWLRGGGGGYVTPGGPEDPAKTGKFDIPMVSGAASGPSDVAYGLAQAGADLTEAEKKQGMTRTRAMAGGGSRAIEGGMRTASVLLPQALATAPAKTLTGLAAGSAAGTATTLGAKALGASPEVANYMGDVAGIGVGGLAAKSEIGSKIAQKTGLSRLGRAITGSPIPHEEAVATALQAFPQTRKNYSLRSSLDRALPEIHASEVESGKTIADAPDGRAVDVALEMVKAAKTRVMGQYRDLTGGQQIPVNFRNVARQLAKAGNNDAATAVVDLMQNEFKTNVSTLDQLEAARAKYNGKLNAYYAKNPAARSVETRANPDLAEDVRMINAIRDAINTTLDSDAGGAAPKEYMQRMKALMDTESQLEQRKPIAERQSQESLPERLSMIHAAGQVARGAIRAFHGDPQGAADIGSAIAGRTVAKSQKEAFSTDGLLRRVFRNYDQMPAPVAAPLTPPPAQSFGPAGPPNVPQGGPPADITAIEESLQRQRPGLRGLRRIGSGGQPLPEYSRGGVIRTPKILVEPRTMRPVATMAENGPEAIVPMKSPIPRSLRRPPELDTPKAERHILNSLKWRMQ